MRPSPMAPRRTPAAAGMPAFTLAEVVVALGVLLVAFLGIITVFRVGHGDITESGRDTAASVVVQSLVESLQNQPAANLPLLNGIDTADPAFCPGAAGSRVNTLCTDWIAQVARLPQGRGTVTVAQVPNPTTGIILNQITISLSWAEVGRGSRQFTVVTARSS